MAIAKSLGSLYVYNLQQNDPAFTLATGKQSDDQPSVSLDNSIFVNGDTVSIYINLYW